MVNQGQRRQWDHNGEEDGSWHSCKGCVAASLIISKASSFCFFIVSVLSLSVTFHFEDGKLKSPPIKRMKCLACA